MASKFFGRKFKLKGFVFSLDAVLAVVIAVTAVAALLAVMSTSKSQSYGNMPLHRAAQDALTLMDKQGTLKGFFNMSDSAAQSKLQSDLALYLPPNMGAKVNVTICSYNGASFDCARYFEAQHGVEGEQKSSARRVFTDLGSNKYGLAIIEVWYQ